MAYPVVQTAVCACSFGAAPAPLTVTSQPTVKICGMAAATIAMESMETVSPEMSPERLERRMDELRGII